MATLQLNKAQTRLIDEIPLISNITGFYFYSSKKSLTKDHIGILDTLVGVTDDTLARWLNITPRTYRNYKKSHSVDLKDNLKEHILILISLYKHGKEVFDNTADFESWLMKPNRVLDGKAPSDFMDTILGVKFIDSRLVAMEYGENA